MYHSHDHQKRVGRARPYSHMRTITRQITGSKNKQEVGGRQLDGLPELVDEIMPDSDRDVSAINGLVRVLSNVPVDAIQVMPLR
jgi:hypothetical protein